MPPDTVGTQPKNADDLNFQIGQHLRQFLASKNTINQDRDFLQSTDLKVAPYFFSPDQETLIKSAVLGLDTTLDGVDMTFITRLIGLG
jgi:hypothetical protein